MDDFSPQIKIPKLYESARAFHFKALEMLDSMSAVMPKINIRYTSWRYSEERRSFLANNEIKAAYARGFEKNSLHWRIQLSTAIS